MGKDFIAVARDLAAGASEAYWRSATSRAYYAAYHVAKEALERAGIRIPDNPNSHERVFRCLNNSHDAQLQDIANDLGLLRRDRIGADYALAGRTLSHRQAEADLTQAEAMIRKLEESPLGTGDATHIAEVIEEYLRKTNQRLE